MRIIAFLAHKLVLTLTCVRNLWDDLCGNHPPSLEKIRLWLFLLENFMNVLWLELVLTFQKLLHIHLVDIQFIQEIVNAFFFLRNFIWNICLIIYALVWSEGPLSLLGGASGHFDIIIVGFLEQTECWGDNGALSIT